MRKLRSESIEKVSCHIFELACVGLGANAVVGFFGSVVTRIRNEKDLYEASTGERMLDAYGLNSLREERFPSDIGPIPKALYYNFAFANKFSRSNYKPYRFYEMREVLESWGGLDPSVMKKNIGPF